MMSSVSQTGRVENTATKVPLVTASFWVIKILTTGVGETASDSLFHLLPPLVAILIGLGGLVVALVAQFRVRRHVPWVYWSAAGMVSIFGTMVADVVHVGLGVSYAALTIGYSLALAALFAAWFAVERTLSIHAITTRRRESFYWAAVLATFALGTAAGDLTAKTLHLGYLTSFVLFAVVIAVPAVAHRTMGLNAIAAFWLAYIVTRPLGASYADWFAGPSTDGGLGFGTGTVTLAGVTALVVAVGYVTKRRGGIPEFPAAGTGK